MKFGDDFGARYFAQPTIKRRETLTMAHLNATMARTWQTLT